MESFLIVGLGTFGKAAALGLMEQGAEVFVVDNRIEMIDEIKDKVTSAAVLDATMEESFRAIGIEDFDCAIVCMTGLESSVLAALILKKLGVPKLIARASSEQHEEILIRIGANQVLQPEKNEAARLVIQLSASHIQSYVSLAEDHVLAEIEISEKIEGRSIKQLDVRAEFKVNIVALKHLVPELTANGRNVFSHKIDDVPDPDAALKAGDVLMVVGKAGNIEAFNRWLTS